MKLQGFRELLLKKAADPSLDNLIRFVRDDVLADIVMESLEKMADAKHMGDAANAALRHFGTDMDPEHEPAMIHDALSHHASRYKAALQNGREALANTHADKIFKIMHMAKRVQKHTGGKLDVEAVPPQPWERTGRSHQFTEDSAPVKRGNKKVGMFVRDTDGWGNTDKNRNWLQQAPHSDKTSQNEVSKHGHTGAYPMEEIRVNGKHLHIEDIAPDDLKGHEEHAIDSHPIMKHYKIPPAKRTAEHDKEYHESVDKHADSPQMGAYFKKHAEAEEADPEGYAARGTKKPDPIHEPLEPAESASSPVDKILAEAQAEPSEPSEAQAEPSQSEQEIRQKLYDDFISQGIPENIARKVLAGSSDE